ncbi:uncharacterized protein LOC130804854 [Amaranthus tricolor]|uniref:uncharacterized protein LOC130804854 n=1 Tax=Amaranthus tricolor TaxID=29722 RepID=UPI00258FBB59|nr:uncharacterized protein LOC130804854 [Amaranthus tricolor]
MPPPSGRAVSNVWSYFTNEPTNNPDVFLCTCQICESQGVKPLVSYNFSRGGGTGSFKKHLVKKHGNYKRNSCSKRQRDHKWKPTVGRSRRRLITYSQYLKLATSMPLDPLAA